MFQNPREPTRLKVVAAFGGEEGDDDDNSEKRGRGRKTKRKVEIVGSVRRGSSSSSSSSPEADNPKDEDWKLKGRKGKRKRNGSVPPRRSERNKASVNPVANTSPREGGIAHDVNPNPSPKPCSSSSSNSGSSSSSSSSGSSSSSSSSATSSSSSSSSSASTSDPDLSQREQEVPPPKEQDVPAQNKVTIHQLSPSVSSPLSPRHSPERRMSASPVHLGLSLSDVSNNGSDNEDALSIMAPPSPQGAGNDGDPKKSGEKTGRSGGSGEEEGGDGGPGTKSDDAQAAQMPPNLLSLPPQPQPWMSKEYVNQYLPDQREADEITDFIKKIPILEFTQRFARKLSYPCVKFNSPDGCTQRSCPFAHTCITCKDLIGIDGMHHPLDPTCPIARIRVARASQIGN
jgi:hypothetical protein